MASFSTVGASASTGEVAGFCDPQFERVEMNSYLSLGYTSNASGAWIK